MKFIELTGANNGMKTLINPLTIRMVDANTENDCSLVYVEASQVVAVEETVEQIKEKLNEI